MVYVLDSTGEKTPTPNVNRTMNARKFVISHGTSEAMALKMSYR